MFFLRGVQRSHAAWVVCGSDPLPCACCLLSFGGFSALFLQLSPHRVPCHATPIPAMSQANEHTTSHADESSAQVWPAMRLYRHALESIFSMLELQDLIQILAVSRSWSAAVVSMKPIHASFKRDAWECRDQNKLFRGPLPPVESIVSSPLLRHLAAVHFRNMTGAGVPLDNASLALLAQHTPNLQSLWCTLTLTPNEPLILPSTLTSLTLQMDRNHTNPAINDVLTALAALPSLSCLHLKLSAFQQESDVKLGLLAACPSLTDLTLQSEHSGWVVLTDMQVDQLRISLGHLHRINVGPLMPVRLAQLLQPPVTARWRDIGQVSVDAHTGDLLLRLPSLTNPHLFIMQAAPVAFLPQLPRLAVLHLDCRDYATAVGAWHIPADDVLASLAQCSCLTELSLGCGFNSAHWSALFAKLPLRKLTILRGTLETLQCFAVGPIAQALEELSIEGASLPLSELPHLYALRRLRTLALDCCFVSRLDDATLVDLTPPTAHFPSLVKLFHQWRTEDGRWDKIQRQGSSFEWMQQRRTA